LLEQKSFQLMAERVDGLEWDDIEFRILAVATRKACLPIVVSVKDGTKGWFVVVDLQCVSTWHIGITGEWPQVLWRNAMENLY